MISDISCPLIVAKNVDQKVYTRRMVQSINFVAYHKMRDENKRTKQETKEIHNSIMN